MHIKIPKEIINATHLGKNRVSIFYQLAVSRTLKGKIVFQPEVLAEEAGLSKHEAINEIAGTARWMIANGYIKIFDFKKLTPKSHIEVEYDGNKFNPQHYALINEDDLLMYQGNNLAEALLVLAAVRLRSGNYKTTQINISKLADLELQATRKRLKELVDSNLMFMYRGYNCVYLDGGIISVRQDN